MINLKWEITRVKWNSDTGGVASADWVLSATEENFVGTVKGFSKFNPDPSSEFFIPVEDLTEDIVISWVHKYVINREGLEKAAIKRMEESKNPVENVTGLPWSS